MNQGKVMYLLLLIMVLGPGTVCFGQKLLFHNRGNEDALYVVGDVIAFRLMGTRAKVTGKITGFEDSLVVFQDFKVNPKNVSHMYVDRKSKNWFFMRYKYKRLLPILGGTYLLADVINTGELNQGTLVLSGSLIGAGILARVLISEALPVTGKRRLLITR